MVLLRALYLYAVLFIPLFAQTSLSSITGIVTDPSGSAIPVAQVLLRNEATGVSERRQTTDAGVYAFPALIAGSYTVQVEAKGFRTLRKTGNIVTASTPISINITLDVGDVADVINVEAAAEQVQTSNASISNTVTQKAIVDLPLNGRNPLNLLVLEPGVVQRSAGAVGTGVHVNGSRDMSHNVTIDGIEANESSVNNPLNNVYRLHPDNIQEYRVTTSNATAEEGRNSGASISIATRTGSNQFHGTLYNFFRNTVLNANEFYANALGTPKPDMKLNIYGATISGPILKDEIHFTFSWGDQKVNFSQPVDQVYGTPSLYTAQARAGNYRYWRNDPNNPFRIGNEVITRNSPLLVDPSTGALRPEVRSCQSTTDLGCVASYNFAAADPRRIGIDPTIKAYMDQRPLPNNFSSGDGLNVASYLWNPSVKVRGPAYMGRIDARVNDNHTIWGRYIHADSNTLGGDPNNGRPQLYPGLPPLGEVFRATKNVAIGHRWVVSSRMVNEFTAGIARFGYLFTQGEANPAWPAIAPWGARPGTAATNAFNSFDPGEINTPRSYRVVTTPQILDNISYVTGAHILKAGFNFRFYRHNDQRGQPGGINVTPVLTFNRNVRPPSDAFAIPAGMDPNDLSRAQGAINDLLGIPARITQTFLGDLQGDAFLPYRTGDSVTMWSQGHRLKQYNFYIQDEWKIRHNVTINAGLRWEINPPPTESHGRVYVPDRPVINSTGLVSFVHADRWFERMNYGAIGPRLGLTWSPNARTVFRAGYAMAFDTLSSFQVTAVAGRVPGLTTQCSVLAGTPARNGCAGLPDLRIAEGFPSELEPPTLKPSQFLTPAPQLLTTAPGLTVFDPNLKVPTVHQWNVSVQRELTGSVMAQASYVARRGTRLYRAYDINQIDAAPIVPSFLAMQQNFSRGCNPSGINCPSGVTPQAVPLASLDGISAAFLNSATTQTELRQNAAGAFAGRVEQTTLNAHLRPNQQFGPITYIDAGGDSYYHSLQTSLRKRFSSGLLFGVAYTFGKSIDTQSVDPVQASAGGGLSNINARTPVDIRNWREERGRSDFDRTHVLTANFIYDLPFARNASGILKALAQGWSLNGLYTGMSGEPFSVRSGVRTANNSHESRAVIVGEAPEVRLQSKEGVLGPVVFGPEAICGGSVTNNCLAAPAPGANGSGRNVFEAPGYTNIDLSVIKRFALTERVSLQLRTEAFNVFNHANFDNPRDASSSSTAINSTLFGQSCCATVAPASTQSIVQTGESARVVQFALKLDF